MNWHSLNFLRLLLPLVFGILFAEFFPEIGSVGWPILLAAVGFLLVLTFKKTVFQIRWMLGAVGQLTLFLLGWQLCFFQNELQRPDHFSKISQSEFSFFIARMDEAPVRTAKKIKARMVVEAIGSAPDSLKKASGNLYVFLDTSFENAHFAYGDRILFRGRIRPTELPRNPNSFNYKRYLHFQNIHYQVFILKNEGQRLSENNGSWVWKMAYASRDRFLEILKKHFPSHDEFAVASALILGYKDDLSDEIKNAYIQTGSMHALAVSGMHVGGLYLALSFFFKRLHRGGRLRRVAEPLVSLLVIWGFTFITGASASVLRAAVMFSVLLLGRSLRRDSDLLNTLAASAFLLLVWNPFLLFDVGFQLSYAAVAGIVLLGKPLTDLWQPPRGLGWAWETISIGFAAQIATFPLSLYYFHQFPMYFWLSGLLVVPLGMVVLWLGSALFLLEMAWPAAAFLLGKPLFGIVWLMDAGIFFIQKLPASLVEGLWISGFAAVFLYIIMGSFGAWVASKRPSWLLAALAGLLFMSTNRAASLISSQTERKIIIYDVPKKSLVDFISGETRCSLTDSLTEKEEKNMAASNQLADEMQTNETIFWENPTRFQKKNLLFDPPFVQFFDKKMVVLDDEKWLREAADTPPISVDFILIRGNPRLKISDCIERFPCSKVIFDASNSFFHAKKWEQECADLNLPFHDALRNGAFVASW